MAKAFSWSHKLISLPLHTTDKNTKHIHYNIHADRSLTIKKNSISNWFHSILHEALNMPNFYLRKKFSLCDHIAKFWKRFREHFDLTSPIEFNHRLHICSITFINRNVIITFINRKINFLMRY